MSSEIVQATAKFMQRVKIKPEEIPAWQTCMQWLSQVAETVAQQERQQQQGAVKQHKASPEPGSPLQED